MASVQLRMFLEVKMQIHEGAQMVAFIYSKGNRRLRSVSWNVVLNSTFREAGNLARRVLSM